VVIIDFHTHIVPPEVKENRSYYLKHDRCFAALYSDDKAKLATAEDLILSMNRAGIDRSVVLNIGWVSAELCRRSNDYIMQSVERYPEHLIGFCSIQPRDSESVAELERCSRGGMRGIGEMRSDIQGFDLGDKATMAPIAEVAQRQGLIILSHASEPVGHAYPGKGTITPELLYQFIANFPGLRVVLAHWGGGLPFYALMPEVAEALRNVYFDTAASPLLYYDWVCQHAVQLVGADKILFGSDYPLIPQERAIKWAASLDVPQEVKNKILGENAERLLL
jgi:predicted TIM-barrel fold metal-dependent hydrolase